MPKIQQLSNTMSSSLQQTVTYIFFFIPNNYLDILDNIVDMQKGTKCS